MPEQKTKFATKFGASAPVAGRRGRLLEPPGTPLNRLNQQN